MKRKTLGTIIVILAIILLAGVVFIIAMPNIPTKLVDTTEDTSSQNETEDVGTQETCGPEEETASAEEIVTFGGISIDDVEPLQNDTEPVEISESEMATEATSVQPEETIEATSVQPEETIEATSGQSELEETTSVPETAGGNDYWGGGATGL